MKKVLSVVIIAVGVIAAVLILNQQVLSSAWGGIAGVFEHPATGGSGAVPAPHAATGTTPFRQPVTLHFPKGNNLFRVAQAAEIQPHILQIDVNPMNVTPGDIQQMYVIVSDPDPIVSVTAKIRTDHRTTEVPLALKGPASSTTLLPQKYYVAKDGQLAFLSSDPGVAAKELQAAGVAFAAAPPLKYAGSWRVEDTHNIYYTTTFITKDAKGRTNSATITWKDSCPAFADNANNTISGSCTMTYTDGVNGGNITISSGVTLTLSSGGDLVFNSGHSITVSGAIAISGGEIQKGILESGTDNDGDGYPGDFIYAASGTDRSKSEIDCYDSNASAYPGEASYFTVVRGSSTDAWGNTGNSYDYNCDGVQTEEYTSEALTCSQVGYSPCNEAGTGCGSLTCSVLTSTTTVPGCGQAITGVTCIPKFGGTIFSCGGLECQRQSCLPSGGTQACK